MPVTAIGANAPSVFVSTPAELQAAYMSLSTSSGGGTIYITSNYPDSAEINLTGGGSNPVHITSANPDDPADISRIALDEVDNVKISNVHVDSTGVVREDFFRDLDITNSTRIEITDSIFTSNGTDAYDPAAPDGVLGERLSMVRFSEDITVTDSYFSGHSQGLTFQESTNITVTGNEITAQQGDGIRLAGVQDVLVANNYLHDFVATPNEFTHSDFIQMWSTNSEIVSANITVTGNVLDTGNGVSVQGIWMRNEAHDAGDTSYVYQNITVTDNLIYTGSANGIGIGQANNVLVANNTLLWNEDAVTVKATGDTSYQPRIRLHEDITNLQVIDNITPRILHGDDADLQGNVIVSYDPSSPNYVDNHFVNADQGGDIGFAGWQLRSDSEWVGLGSSNAQPGVTGWEGGSYTPPTTTAPPPPAPEPEPEPEPPAPEPEPEPSAPAAALNPLFAFGGHVKNVSLFGVSPTSPTVTIPDPISDTSPDSQQIGAGETVELAVDDSTVRGLDSFGLEMDIRLLDPSDAGRFVHFPRVFEAFIEADGSVSFVLRTDTGDYRVNSGEVSFDDLQTHNFAVGYDADAGVLSMSIDGTVVDKIEASGTLTAGPHHNLNIGSIWGDSVGAVVDDIFFGTDPLEAGVDLSLEEGESFLAPPSGVSARLADVAGEPDAAAAAGFETLFAIDFESGIADSSEHDSSFKAGDAGAIVDSADGQGFQISDGTALTLSRFNEQIFELDKFALELDVQLLDETDTGRFLHFPKIFEASVGDDRSVTFSLTTDQGTFTVNSGEVTLDDLEMHSFGIVYDGEVGQLAMTIDGTLVDNTEATGTTGAMEHHGLTVGSAWGDSLLAVVDNVWLGAPAEGAAPEAEQSLFDVLFETSVPLSEADIAEDTAAYADDFLFTA